MDSLKHMTTTPPPISAAAQDETVEICRNLIRIDSSNYGDNSGPGEREAAEYVAGLLSEVGLEPEVFESAPRGTSLVTRFAGKNTDRPAQIGRASCRGRVSIAERAGA